MFSFQRSLRLSFFMVTMALSLAIRAQVASNSPANVPAEIAVRISVSYSPEPESDFPLDYKPSARELERSLPSAPSSARIPKRLPADRPGAAVAIARDVLVDTGSETALAVDHFDGETILVTHNFGADLFTMPMAVSNDGNVSWTRRTFPFGADNYNGQPFDPWAFSGNSAGELYALFIRRHESNGNTHVLIARSTDSGQSFDLFYQKMKEVFQDRAMAEIDLTEALGGGPGSAADGTIYMAYDDDGPQRSGYVGSFFQAVSAEGNETIEIQVSAGAADPTIPFRGLALQPLPGVIDGTVFLCGVIERANGRNINFFHELTNAGAGPNRLGLSILNTAAVGQIDPDGPGINYSINGHRIDQNGYLEIDRSDGPRRGTLYFINGRNPNSSDPSLDQGDIFLAIAADVPTQWVSAQLPTRAGRTQFNPMIDVDDQGMIHVAYYENVTGSIDDGVLNASTVNLYYINSLDGGETWSTFARLNQPRNALNMEDPPPRPFGGYLIGDYNQMRATGVGEATKVYVVWTGYDKDINTGARDLVWVTTVSNLFQTPSAITVPWTRFR